MDKFVIFAVLLVFGLPKSKQFSKEWSRIPYAQHTFMLSNIHPRTSYNMEDFMQAFGGDAISTNTFSDGENFKPEHQLPTEIKRPQAEEEISQVGEAEVQELQTESAPITQVPQIKRKTTPRKEEDVAEGSDNFWPLPQDSKSRNIYSSFFPIMIGGSQNSRGTARDGNDGYIPGGTAISNSFSTGRGGVASSHATSFGDPYLGMLFRNAIFKRISSEKSE